MAAKANTELVVGRIPAIECLLARKRAVKKVYLLSGVKELRAIEEAAGDLHIQKCARKELDQIARNANHQGVVLEADPLPVLNADDWVRGNFPEQSVVLALDGIEDPHNFGAAVRSAAACGAVGVLFAKDRAAPISPASVKSAAGAMEYVDLVRATNLVRAIDALKARGFWIAALDPESQTDLWDADLKGRIVVVVGSEGKGVRRLVREHCDLYLRIPISGPITSLNASVSAAIALVECVRQRQR